MKRDRRSTRVYWLLMVSFALAVVVGTSAYQQLGLRRQITAEHAEVVRLRAIVLGPQAEWTGYHRLTCANCLSMAGAAGMASTPTIGSRPLWPSGGVWLRDPGRHVSSDVVQSR